MLTKRRRSPTTTSTSTSTSTTTAPTTPAPAPIQTLTKTNRGTNQYHYQYHHHHRHHHLHYHYHYHTEVVIKRNHHVLRFLLFMKSKTDKITFKDNDDANKVSCPHLHLHYSSNKMQHFFLAGNTNYQSVQ